MSGHVRLTREGTRGVEKGRLRFLPFVKLRADRRANWRSAAVIKHYALRLFLWLRGYTPFNFVKFLDHCAKLILLKKVGGGYIFIHRMLLEYFADLPIQAASKMSASDRSDTG